MNFFQYKNNKLYAEDIPVQQLAEQFGTPLYVYSRATLERHWHAFDSAFGNRPHLICFAVKSCYRRVKHHGKTRFRFRYCLAR